MEPTPSPLPGGELSKRAHEFVRDPSVIRAILVSFALALLIQVHPQESGVPEQRSTPERASAAVRVFVKDVKFVKAEKSEGKTVFSPEELTAVISSYLGREVTSVELEEARRALTLHYVNAGYVNSGAQLPDQDVSDGIVTFEIIEGALSEITIRGNQRLRSGYIRNRILRGAGEPLNLGTLRDPLLQLRQNPNIRDISARLRRGDALGEGKLEVRVEEAIPYRIETQVRNDRSPSVGAELLELIAAHENLTGNSDLLQMRYGVVKRDRDGAKFPGLDNIGAGYTLPITSHNTSASLYFDQSDESVIEEPFDFLNIESQTRSYAFGLRHPLLKNFYEEIAVGLTADYRSSETFLLGEPFSFSHGAVDGKSVISALRLSGEWIRRGSVQVLASRLTLGWGLDVLDATRNENGPDGQFVSVLGQVQYLRRLWHEAAQEELRQGQLILSGSFQWTGDPLLPLERLRLGGAHTVRGYRENQLLRDKGILATAEYRLPVLISRNQNILQVSPFIDFGIGWNSEERISGPREIASAGIGLIYTPNNRVRARLDWGYPFRDLKSSTKDAQDLGLHFSVSVRWF